MEITTQRAYRGNVPLFLRNYPTNNRMLMYDQIDELFFIDTFFSTKKAKKSLRGNTCYQLVVIDKGFIYVVPIKSKSEVLQAMY